MHKTGFRVGSTNCVVFGCHNTYSNTDSTVKFYLFPSRPHDYARRVMWLDAIKGQMPETCRESWTPKSYSRICSQHFVGNSKSHHPDSPSYIPTIFSKVCNKKQVETKKKRAGLSRSLKRQEIQSRISIRENKKIKEKTSNDSSMQCNFENNDTLSICNCSQGPSSEALTTSGEKASVPSKDFGGSSPICLLGFHGVISLDSDEKLAALAGVRFNVFNYLLSVLCDKSHGKECLALKNRLLLFLMKMKLEIPFSFLGTIFNVHRTTAQRIFSTILSELTEKLRDQ